jgi:hypothetical protein
VTEPDEAQPPLAQLAEPWRDHALPLGPVPPPDVAHLPPAQLAEPVLVTVPPGPDTVLLRVQAPAPGAAAAINAAPSARVAMVCFMSVLSCVAAAGLAADGQRLRRRRHAVISAACRFIAAGQRV